MLSVAADIPAPGGSGGVFNVAMVDVSALPLPARQLLIQSGAQGVSSAPYIDKNPPHTAAFIAGPTGANGWYTGSVQVTLLATDIDGPSDIASTTYNLDGGPAIGYNGPITVSGDGIHTIQFGSVDVAGNVETPRPSQTISVDATPPTFVTFPSSITVPATSASGAVVTYTLPTSTDATSGVSSAGVSCAPASGSTFPLGQTTATCQVADNAGNVARATFLTIVQAPTTTNASVSPATVKYNDYTTLTATVTPTSAGGQYLTGSVQFYLNGNAVGSQVAINSSGVAVLSQVQVNLQAGSYSVKAVFSSTNANFTGSTGTTSQPVTQENSFTLYTGDTIAQVGTSLNLRATVWDSAAAGYPGVNPETGPSATIGDITKIWIAFDIYPAASCGSGTPSTLYAPVALTGTPGISTAKTTLSSESEVSYCVVSLLAAGNAGGTNQFYTAPNAEVAGLDFYVNSGQFATGGGWIYDPPGSGSHGNFGFNARYNSSGSPKGQMVYVYRATYNGVLADFIIKSNALNALQFAGTTYPISSTLQGKANVQVNRASDGLSLFSAGNYTFSSTVTDSGQNGNVGKQFSLNVYGNGGVPYHSVPAGTLLQGGNVVVHSK
jgi:hypothetical protein